MAVAVTLVVTPTDLPNYIARIAARFVDDETGSTINVSMMSADVSDTPHEEEAWDILWSKYQKALTKKNQIAVLVTALEGRGEANLQARL